MAILANTYTSYDTTAIREQLDDVIYNIAPTETPFASSISKGKAENIFFEWTIDTLAAAANNAQLDGDDVSSFTAITPPVRTGNRCQISRKVFLISETEQAIKKAGRPEEVAYQIALKGKELKRDIEVALTQNSTLVVGTTGVGRQTRGLEGWVATNSNLGVGGLAPNPTTNVAPTDGTQRAFTEAMLKDIQQKVFSSGGNADVLMVGPAQKQIVSTFAGNSTRFDKGEDMKVYAALEIYVGDFGEIKIVPNRFQRNRTAFLLEMDLWQIMQLRPINTQDLAKTGDADKRMLITEYGLKSKQEAASGAIRDLS
jgi:hypothetical protein